MYFLYIVSIVLVNADDIMKPPLTGRSECLEVSLPTTYRLEDYLVEWDIPHNQYYWYVPFNNGSGVEHGWAEYVTPFKWSIDNETGAWNSTGSVACRVIPQNHTSCCCQYMKGNPEYFEIIEYCHVVDEMKKSPYDTCIKYANCPKTNETAWKHQEDWPVKPYWEIWSSKKIDGSVSNLPHDGRGTSSPLIISN